LLSDEEVDEEEKVEIVENESTPKKNLEAILECRETDAE
jgi:hypothetical protein